MKIEGNIKKKILKDWQESFPSLGAFSQNGLYQIRECLVIGVELIRMPSSPAYRPYFVCYPLWKESLKECFSGPIILWEFFDLKGMQIQIQYSDAANSFEKYLPAIENQTPLPFDDMVNLSSVVNAFERYSKHPPNHIQTNSYFQARMTQIIVELLVYFGEASRVQVILEQVESIAWDRVHFSLFLTTPEKWKSQLPSIQGDRENILRRVKSNLAIPKLQKLPKFEIMR